MNRVKKYRVESALRAPMTIFAKSERQAACTYVEQIEQQNREYSVAMRLYDVIVVAKSEQGRVTKWRMEGVLMPAYQAREIWK